MLVQNNLNNALGLADTGIAISLLAVTNENLGISRQILDINKSILAIESNRTEEELLKSILEQLCSINEKLEYIISRTGLPVSNNVIND